MTADEWTAMIEWVAAHWTRPWPIDHQVQWFNDLNQYDASIVWSAIHDFYNEGSDFPPTGSKLKAKCVVKQRAQSRPERAALPEPDPKPEWKSDYAMRRFGESMTGLQLIERIHAERRRDQCGNPDCGLHDKVNA